MATTRGERTAPHAWLRALAGFFSAAVALGVGHLIAALYNPGASPVVAVGSQLVDAAPTPAKDLAVRYLGNADKPVLIGSVTVVVLVAGALLGLVAWKRPRVASVGVATLGIIAGVVALLRPGFGSRRSRPPSSGFPPSWRWSGCRNDTRAERHRLSVRGQSVQAPQPWEPETASIAAAFSWVPRPLPP